MSDALALRRRIELLLSVSGVVLGCSREEASTATTIAPDPPKKKSMVDAAGESAPSTSASAVSPPGSLSGIVVTPIGIPHYGCQPRKVCERPSDAARAAVKGSGTALGCPLAIDTTKLGASVSGYASATFDEAATRASRTDAGVARCCYLIPVPCGGGRPLIDAGEVRVAELRPGAGWSAPMDNDVMLDERAGLAWLDDARMEHASVASFARASLELLALGAPAELVAACHRAALDEIEHARLCFAMAARYSGRAVEPGPLQLPAPRACSFVDVARNTAIEGCFAETVAALVAARAAARDPEGRAILERIAADETAHAALAFRIVAWCRAEGGDEVERALAALEFPSELPCDAATAREAWALVVRPLLGVEARGTDAGGIAEDKPPERRPHPVW